MRGLCFVIVPIVATVVTSVGFVAAECFGGEPEQRWLPISIIKQPDGLEVLAGGELFFRYVISGAPKPYCWPVLGPTGEPMTRAYPMKRIEGEAHDHPHQRSMWFTHGDVNGVSFWHESAGAGRQRHREFLKIEGGRIGRLWAGTDWLTSEGKKVCEDVRKLTIRATARMRIIDWDITVTATEGPLRFGDTKEGTFGVRVASSMRADRGGLIINSNGQTNRDAWGKRARWVDYSGKVNGKLVGIAIMDHPSSLRHPTYWHVRTYGLFAANPFGLHNFLRDRSVDGSLKLRRGQSARFRYRVLFHLGDAKTARIAELYERYAQSERE